ncbi:25944_t:CDS:2, partial [Racocetra persica]
ASIRKAKQIQPAQFQRVASKLFKANNKEYSAKFVKLATDISNIDQTSIYAIVEYTKAFYQFLIDEMPQHWVSTPTLLRWNNEITALSFNQNHPIEASSRFYGYGIMNSISKRLVITIVKLTDLLHCNAKMVSTMVFEACQQKRINPKKCYFWLTDNTAYMSSKLNSAVAKFNLLATSKSFWIPCRLHAIYISLINFENMAFGKINGIKRLSLKEHPHNLLYLAFHLHDSYNVSDKDSLLNLKSEILHELYKVLFNFEMNKYQQPIRQWWLYELKTAKQYLNRREVHICFAQFFIKQLENAKNVSKSYLYKWQIFFKWLMDTQLNLQIQCLVKFDEKFYEPIYNFLISYNPTLQIYQQNNINITLLPGNHTYEMLDRLFEDELADAKREFNTADLENFHKSLCSGIENVLNRFIKWIETWIHLPLCVCRLDSENEPEFVRAFLKVFFNKDSSKIPSLKEIFYTNLLNKDLSNGHQNTFGLLEALSQHDFLEKFKAFADSDI